MLVIPWGRIVPSKLAASFGSYDDTNSLFGAEIYWCNKGLKVYHGVVYYAEGRVHSIYGHPFAFVLMMQFYTNCCTVFQDHSVTRHCGCCGILLSTTASYSP
jgi:Na+/alanine symporter